MLINIYINSSHVSQCFDILLNMCGAEMNIHRIIKMYLIIVLELAGVMEMVVDNSIKSLKF